MLIHDDRMRMRGFTLLDLSVVLVIVGIVGVGATSTMQKTLTTTQLVRDANTFFEDMVRLRNEVMVGNPTNQQVIVEASILPAYLKRNLVRSCTEWIDNAPAYTSHAISQQVVVNDYPELNITWPDEGTHHLGICMDSSGRALQCTLTAPSTCVPKTVPTVITVRKRSDFSLIGNIIIRTDGTMLATWAESDNKQSTVLPGMTFLMARSEPPVTAYSAMPNMQVLVDGSRSRTASIAP